MAAPPGPSPTVLAVLAEANTDGLFFDVAIATAAPSFPGRPPAPAAVVPYVGPPPAAGAVPPQHRYCHDRGHHTPWGPGPATAPVNPCASALNPTFQAVPFLNPPGLYNRPCLCNDDLHGNGANHRICPNCIVNTRNQPWWRTIFNDITVSPGRLPVTAAERAAAPLQPLGAWRQFQTHLCRKCEILEQAILNERLIALDVAGGLPPTGIRAAEMIGHVQGYPWVTCICCNCLVYGDRNHDLCIRHRHLSASNEHNRNLIVREENDYWLRTTGRTKSNPHEIINLDTPGGRKRKRIEQRERDRIFRACRCGADIKALKGRLPEVLLCLGCEGVVHIPGFVTVTPGVTGVNPPPGVTFPHASTRASEESLRLRRPRG